MAPRRRKKNTFFQHHFRSIIFGLHVNVFATEAFSKNFKFPPGSEVCLKDMMSKSLGSFMVGVCWQVDFLFTESDVFVGDQRKRTKLQQNLAKHQSG